jgi:hypothetical protein
MLGGLMNAVGCLRWLRCWSAWIAIMAVGVAQEKPPARPEPEEVEVLALGARELGAYAAVCEKNGFPKRARQLWREVLGEYQTEDEAARKALGFVRVGTAWQRDPKHEAQDREELDAAAAQKLAQRFEAVAQRLGEAHRSVALALHAVGKAERATYHQQRTLRFLPEDGKVAAVGKLEQFEGVTGTPADLALLRRSRLMDRAVARLIAQAMPAKEVDTKDATLDAAGLPYKAVQSAHFVVFGDFEVAVLQTAAAWAERALAFCGEAFAGYDGFPARGDSTRKLAFFQQKASWVKLIEAHRNSLGAERVEFITKNASATRLHDLHTAGPEGLEVVYDLAVRWVVQDYAGFASDALREGIGHAVVAMFFGRNLVFSVGQQQSGGTSSGQRQDVRLLLPDLDTWRELAVEIAWAQGTTPAARLPLLKAAEFPTDGRIKAWSFCDYLLRRDPGLLKHLDASGSGARTQNVVIEAFQERSGQALPLVDAGWRRFWTEDSAVKRAVLQKLTPLEAVSKEAPVWLEQFNRMRGVLGAPPVGWSSQLSTDCKQHADYLKLNKDAKGPEQEHTQLPGKPGYSNSGRGFAAQALVWRDKDVKRSVESWLLLPGYRDALLNRNLDTVGLYAEGGLVVLDAQRGRQAGTTVTSSLFPAADLQGGRKRDPIPAAVDVEWLGPEVRQLLVRHQRGKQKQVGFPLTLHLHNSSSEGVQCTVTAQGAPVAGWLVRGNGAIRRTSAPGLWVFYPAEPWKKGIEVKASWTWPGGSHEVIFTAN